TSSNSDAPVFATRLAVGEDGEARIPRGVVVEIEAIHRAEIGLEDGGSRGKDVPKRPEVRGTIYLRFTLIPRTIGSVADGEADLPFQSVQRFGQVVPREAGWALPVRARERQGETQGNRRRYPSRPESRLGYACWERSPWHNQLPLGRNRCGQEPIPGCDDSA